MDSDDTIDAENGWKLRALAHRTADRSVLGYVMQVHCPGPGEDGETGVTVVDHVKLFRNLPDLRFTGRIHEQVLPAINRAGGRVEFTDVFVVHSGYDHSPEGQARKLERDLRLLNLELEEQPGHPFTLFNLGMTYADIKEHRRAVDFLQRCIAKSPPTASHVRKALAWLISSHHGLGNLAGARKACDDGLRRFPNDEELRWWNGVLLQEQGRPREAAEAFLDLLHRPDERHFSSVDRGLRGHLARCNLALAYEDLGEETRAEEQWRLITAETPRYRPGWRGLGELLLCQGKHDEATALASRLVGDRFLRVEGLLLRGRLEVARGKTGEARRDFERAASEANGDLTPLRALCRLLFEQGDPADAEKALAELLRRAPDDAPAAHNLGTVYLRLGKPQAAAECYRHSLQHRPNAPHTYLQLGHALSACKRLDEAVAAWEQAYRLDPDNQEAREALTQAARVAGKA